MLSFQKLLFSAALLVVASGPVAFAAPVLAHEMSGMSMDMVGIPEAMATTTFRRDEAADALDAMMADPDFNPFSALKSAFNVVKSAVTTIAPKVAQVAKIIRPIVDTVSKVASITPLAPVANVLDDAVDVAASAREELD